jgi:hypothetical protein
VKELKQYLLNLVQPRIEAAAADVVNLILEKFDGVMEASVSMLAGELDIMDVAGHVPAKPMRRKSKKVARADLADDVTVRGLPRKRNHKGNSCGTCGQPGVTSITCGKTPQHPGTYAGSDRQPRTPRTKPARESDEVEDSDAADEARVLAHQPPAPQAPPRSPPPARPPLIVRPATLLMDMERAKADAERAKAERPPPSPKKTVDRDKAMKEIRAQQLRSIAAKRKPRLEDYPDDDDEDKPLATIEPDPGDEEWESDLPGEGDAVKLNSSQL